MSARAMRLALSAAACLALAAPATAAAPPFRMPAPVTRTLPNGLEVGVFPRPGSGVVSLLLLVPAGATAEPAGQEGVATVTAEMLRRGTTSRDAASWALELHRLGGELVATANRDYSTFGGTFLAADFESAVELLSDAVRFPRFDENELQNVQLQSARFRALQAGVEERTLRTLFGDHPYGRSPYGTRESLGRLSPAMLRAFHAARWTPAGARLAVAGDVDPDRTMRTLEQWLGPWSGTGAPAPATREVAPPARARVVVLDRPGTRAEVRVATLAPARGHADEAAMLVAQQLYGGAPSERRGAERLGFGRDVRTSFIAMRDAGVFSAGVLVAADSAAAAAERLVAALRALHAPPTAEALESARRLVRQTFPLGLETPAQIAAAWVAAEHYGQPFAPSDLTADGDAIAAAARRWADPARAVIVVAGPADLLQGPLARLGEVSVARAGEDDPVAATPPVAAPRPAPAAADVARGRDIVRRALATHGGAKLRGIKDSRVEAELTLIVNGQPFEGIMVQVRQEPDRMVFVSEIGGISTRQTLVGDRAWQVVGDDSTVVDLEPDMIAALRAGFESDLPHLLIAASDPKAVVHRRGVEKWDGVDAHAVVVEAPAAPARTLYFHPENHRLLGFDQGEGEGMVARRRFGDYRAVQGVLWPHDEERLLAGETVMRVHVRDVRINAGLAKDVFARP